MELNQFFMVQLSSQTEAVDAIDMRKDDEDDEDEDDDDQHGHKAQKVAEVGSLRPFPVTAHSVTMTHPTIADGPLYFAGCSHHWPLRSAGASRQGREAARVQAAVRHAADQRTHVLS